MKGIVFILLLGGPSWLEPVLAHAISDAAIVHKRTLTRTARVHAGLDAPVSLYAAQIHQESGWRIDARSPAGAEGLAQFMPATSEWFALRNPRDLTTAQPFNPAWAMRALVLYDQHLFKQIQASSPCEKWAFTLSAYNGGIGWVNRDKQLALASGANPLVWFGETEHVNAGRSKAAFAENRHYPQAIIYHHQPLYVAAGWGAGQGGGVCHAF